MTSDKTPVLRLSSLFAGYGRFDVVRDVDLRVDEGEAVALLGPNGAGKTTVLRAIMGLVKHRRGTIQVGDADVSSLPPYRIARGLAAIAPEGRRLFLDQSVEDNLILGALHLRRDKQRVQDLLNSVYNLFPVLRDYRRRRSSFLSGGEQQMVAIGRMLMSDPKILLLDEPAAGIPSNEIHVLLDAIHSLPDDISILMIEHDMQMVKRFASSVSLLVNGQLRMTGAADDVMNSQEVRSVYLGNTGQDRFNLDAARV